LYGEKRAVQGGYGHLFLRKENIFMAHTLAPHSGCLTITPHGEQDKDFFTGGRMFFGEWGMRGTVLLCFSSVAM